MKNKLASSTLSTTVAVKCTAAFLHVITHLLLQAMCGLADVMLSVHTQEGKTGRLEVIG